MAIFELKIKSIKISKFSLIIFLEHGKDLYPRHSGFDLMFDCEQCLNTRTSRILLTYEKVQTNVDDEGLASESKVHAMRNGFRELYFQPTKPGTIHPKVWLIKGMSHLDDVIFRRRLERSGTKRANIPPKKADHQWLKIILWYLWTVFF